ncbi:hypothetical protein [Nocardioides sp. InS609-2]|uniref:hypothetical protein n=1 Tax=Nocardioides sp. InS609-2 TaxID=2760705 RepID=UPI0020C0CEA2|nr:hypothetical protein [Nocardioides sp. InS609-2]
MTTTTVTPVYLEATLSPTGAAERREIAGLALPYGEETDRPNWLTGASRQRWDEATVLDGSQLFYGHDHLGNGLPIGLITSSEQTAEGLRITARISKTSKGDEVYTLLQDGVLTKFSVGLFEDVWHLEDDGALQVHDHVKGLPPVWLTLGV